MIQKRKSYYRVLDFDYWTDEINSALINAKSGRSAAGWSPTDTQVLKASRVINGDFAPGFTPT